MLSELIKSFVNVFMVPETKLDNSFPEGQFFTDSYKNTPFKFDWNGNDCGIVCYIFVRTYQQKSSNVISLLPKVKINLHKKLIVIRKNDS